MIEDAFSPESLDISSLAFSQNPYAYYDRLRPHGNVHHLEASSCWLVIGYDEIVEVLGNYELFTSTGAVRFDPLLLGCDPPAHTRHRKILEGTQGPFAKSSVQKLEDRIRQTCGTLLESCKEKEVFDVISNFAAPLSSLVILDMLGIIPDDVTALREWTQTAVSSRSIHNTKFAEEQWELLRPHIEKWVNAVDVEKRGGALSHVINHPDAQGYFTTEQIVHLAKILLIGGNETTPNLIGNTLRILLSDKALYDAVRKDRNLIPKLIHEILRYEAPTQIIHRNTTEDVEIGGVMIPKGSLVALAIGAANRDPRRFKDPDTFNLHREEGKILSFGFGPHYCIGAHLAKLEATVAIGELLDKFSEMAIHPDYRAVYHYSSHVRGLTNLPLTVTTTETHQTGIAASRTAAFRLIQDEVARYGHVPTYQNFPDFPPKKDKGWHYTYPSPFVHANVLYSLLNSVDNEAIRFVQEQSNFLLDLMEAGGIWRFWPLDNCENPVPPDVDDTAICSLVLKKLGHSVSNEEILRTRISPDGRLLTWVMPDRRLFWKSPSLFWKIWRERKQVQPTLTSGMLHPDDTEVGVTANVLLYLGEDTETKTVIERCIHDWRSGTDTFNFYENGMVVAYHIARAYHEGISGFGVLKDDIVQMIEKEAPQQPFPELLLSALSLRHLGETGALTDYVTARIINHCLIGKYLFQSHPYFTSKDRVFFAGSPCLTAAWFLEATNGIHSGREHSKTPLA